MSKEKILEIIKKFFIIITAPIWYPWKVLFVRKEGKKFHQVDETTKKLRIIRAPFTKTLKFMLFLFIILVEVALVYKVRYSVVGYPLTKNAVQSYYLNEYKLKEIGLDNTYTDEFKTALDYIDTWSLDEKNKMNVILDSNFTKLAIKYLDKETFLYIINKFNDDEVFREDVRIVVKNINDNITRLIKEMPKEHFDKLNNFLKPIITISSWALDYKGVLDIGEAVFKWWVTEENIQENSYVISKEDIELAIKTGKDFSNGMSYGHVQNYWK